MTLIDKEVQRLLKKLSKKPIKKQDAQRIKEQQDIDNSSVESNQLFREMKKLPFSE